MTTPYTSPVTWTTDAPSVGRCGVRRPNIVGKPEGQPPLEFCRLPHGHSGWHLGDDGSEWSPPPLRAPRLNRHEAVRIAKERDGAA